MITLGVAKTTFNSSVALIESQKDQILKTEILLTERLTRKKASGAWPLAALEVAQRRVDDLSSVDFYENRPVVTPAQYETRLCEQMPFYEVLLEKKLSHFLSRDSSRHLPHHFSHALSAVAQMPFNNAIILVVDGAGSKAGITTLFSVDESLNGFDYEKIDGNLTEEISAYLYNDFTLKPIFKRWQKFRPFDGRYVSTGLGNLYETVSEYIFNDKNSAGKVMGLAAYGDSFPITNPEEFLCSLKWRHAFKGRGKKEWESSSEKNRYISLASSAQKYFECTYTALLLEIKRKFPQIENLVLTGGCALNCTNNMKIYNSGLFHSIYVPPFPGDEGISLGLAYWPIYQKGIRSSSFNTSYLGPIDNLPNEKEVVRLFGEHSVRLIVDIAKHSARKISEGKVIAWYQGRSECGPRALGNRSILCRVDKTKAKDFLNAHVKFREGFRPYACSITKESVHKYFDVPKNFDNSYMSFACRAKIEYRELFKEVTHIDNTSRLQTVTKLQNDSYHNLLVEVEKITGVPAVLNTSMNVMGEPIVESLQDAKRFFDEGTVDALVVGNFYIERHL